MTQIGTVFQRSEQNRSETAVHEAELGPVTWYGGFDIDRRELKSALSAVEGAWLIAVAWIAGNRIQVPEIALLS